MKHYRSIEGRTDEEKMQIFRVDPVAGASLLAQGGQLARLHPLARSTGSVFSGILHLAPGGVLGPHEALIPRLILVVRGSGWARSGPPDKTPVSAGDAVCWRAQEEVELGTEVGLIGLVLEGEDLQMLATSLLPGDSG